MGVLNATPDSFGDGGPDNRVSAALHRIDEMIEQGASIIDIGGESTRPYAPAVEESEEIRELFLLCKRRPRFSDQVIFSIDTTKWSSRTGLRCGALIINDVSGLQKSPAMAV